jgi:hypothetical protein
MWILGRVCDSSDYIREGNSIPYFTLQDFERDPHGVTLPQSIAISR